MTAILLFVWGATAASDQPVSAKMVLVLNSYHPHLLWTDHVVDGIAETLDASDTKVELFIEYMDTKRFEAGTQLPAFGDYLRRKYSNRRFDAVIASDNHAFEFVVKHRNTLFASIPIVFCGVNYFDPPMLNGVDNITGVVEAIDIKATLDLALRLHPDTRRVVVINDRTATGKANRQLVDELTTGYASLTRFDFWDSLTMAEIKQHAARLNSGTIVLLLSYTRDANGATFSYADSIGTVAADCSVPIYGVWEFYLGRGIVGGMLTSGFLQGKTAAELALDILDGTSADDIEVIVKSPNRLMFDAVQLNRFGIKRNTLPPQSRIVNSSDQLFVKYQKWVWTGMMVLVVQMVVILSLSRNIQLRRQAESDLKMMRFAIDHINDAAFWIKPDGRLFYVNHAACRQLNTSREKLLTRSIFDIAPDIHTETWNQQWQSLRDRGSATFCANLTHADGRSFPADISANLFTFNDRKFICAFLRDMTRRHQIEETLRRHNLLLTTLHETAMGLISQLTLDDLIEAIVARAADFAKTTHGYFYLYDESRDALVLKTGMGLYQDQIGYVVQRNMGVAGRVLETRKVMVVNDYPDWSGRHPDKIWDAVQSIVGVPLQSNSKFVGVIGLLHTEKGRQISGDDIEMLQRFGDLAALALNNAQLYSQLEAELTERKQAQKALAESEEKFRKLFIASPIWMELVTLEEGRFIEANNAFFQITGYSRDEIIGRPSVDVGIWLEPSHRAEAVALMRETNRLSAHPCRFRMKNGHIRDFLWSAEVIEVNGKRCALSAILDITDQKRVEGALKESENRLRLFVKHTPAPVALCDRKMRYLAYSRRWVTDYGLPEGNLTGRCHYDVFPEIPMRWQQQHQRCLAGEVVKSEAEQFRRSDGSIDWIRREVHPWLNDVGEVGGVIIFSEVITSQVQAEKERRQLEMRLQQSQRLEAIGTLSGGIAHDFNNILTPILIQADMGLLRLPPESPVRTHFKKIRQAGDRAKHLVKQVLAFSRPSEEVKKPFAVEPVIKEVLKLIRSSLPATIDVRHRFDTEDSIILGDPTQLHQVVMNLCTNAGYAMRGQNGILTIDLAPAAIDQKQAEKLGGIAPGTYLELRVSDTGKGIPTDIIERIFEPYFTTKDVSEGTGLGLAVAHGIVIAHGGSITVQSIPGQGTTFRVLLPKLEQWSKSRGSIPERLSGGCEKILLIDDEPATTEVLQEILEEIGYQVVGFTDALEAYSAFKAQPEQFDLVITDQTMPNITGVGLSAKLRKLRPDLPIILCTGYSESVTREKITSLGIKALVMKPFDTHEITRTIRSVLANTGQPADGPSMYA